MPFYASTRRSLLYAPSTGALLPNVGPFANLPAQNASKLGNFSIGNGGFYSAPIHTANSPLTYNNFTMGNSATIFQDPSVTTACLFIWANTFQMGSSALIQVNGNSGTDEEYPDGGRPGAGGSGGGGGGAVDFTLVIPGGNGGTDGANGQDGGGSDQGSGGAGGFGWASLYRNAYALPNGGAGADGQGAQSGLGGGEGNGCGGGGGGTSSPPTVGPGSGGGGGGGAVAVVANNVVVVGSGTIACGGGDGIEDYVSNLSGGGGGGSILIMARHYSGGLNPGCGGGSPGGISGQAVIYQILPNNSLLLKTFLQTW